MKTKPFTKWRVFLTFFSWAPFPAYVCLGLVCLGLNGRKMWQERVRDCAAPQRYSTSPRGLSVTASCGIQFTLDGSLFTQGDGVNKEQFNHRIPPLFSFSPCMQNDGIKGNRGEREENHVKQITAKQRNVWYGLGLWRCSVEPNVCVCDKTGVSLLSEGANRRKGWSSGASALFYPVVSHAARP